VIKASQPEGATHFRHNFQIAGISIAVSIAPAIATAIEIAIATAALKPTLLCLCGSEASPVVLRPLIQT
jgi:hypothetical protein